MFDSVTDSLEGIRLTADAKTPIKEIEFVGGDARIDAIEDPACITILEVMREGMPDIITKETFDDESGDRVIRQKKTRRFILTIAEIERISRKMNGDESTLTKAKIYHHLPKLIEFGYVIKYGELVKGKRKTDFYRRTAGLFVFSRLPGQSAKMKRKIASETVDDIVRLFKIEISKEERKELVDLYVRAMDIETKGRKKVVKLADSDFATRDTLPHFAELVRLHAFSSDEWVKIRKRISEILFGK